MYKNFSIYLLKILKEMAKPNLYKGSIHTILLKLLGDEGKMYGYEITQKVKDISNGDLNITEGALYPALHKLEADGLLTVEVAKVDGRLRKYYKLTEDGAKESVQKLSELEAYLETMQNLLQPKLT